MAKKLEFPMDENNEYYCDLDILKKAMNYQSKEKSEEPLDKKDDEDSEDFFDFEENDKIQELLKIQKEKFKTLDLGDNEYFYIWEYYSYKAASFLIEGAEKYRKSDYFGYPLEEWNEDKLKIGCEQIIYYCAGIESDKTCFEKLSETDIRNLFEMFHFRKKGEVENKGNNIKEMSFCHKLNNRRFPVLFKIDENNNYKNDFFFYLTVKNEKIKLCEMANGIIKIFTDNPSLGVSVEYEYIKTIDKIYKINEQSLRKMEINNEVKYVDVIKIEYPSLVINFGKNTPTIKKEIIFDISSFKKN